MNLPKPTNEWYSGADQGAGLVDQRKVKEMETNREWNGTTDCWTFERSHATSLVPTREQSHFSVLQATESWAGGWERGYHATTYVWANKILITILIYTPYNCTKVGLHLNFTALR